MNAPAQRYTPPARYRRLTVRLLLCALMALGALLLSRWVVFRALELRLVDLRVMAASYLAPANPDLVVIGVDDESLARLEPAVGRWPWPRALFAGVLDYCAGAHAVGLDIIFSEGDWQFAGGDDLLADTAAELGNVVVAAHFGHRDTPGNLADEVAPYAVKEGALAPLDLPVYSSALLPYPRLRESVAGIGHVNYVNDEDGAVRSYLVALRAGGHTIPSLAWALARLARDPGPARVERVSRHAFRFGDAPLHLNRQGRFLVAPPGRTFRHAFTQYRVADVLEAWKTELDGGTPDLERSAFDDKIVLIGSMATGLEGADLKVTSLSPRTAGVKIVAAAVDNIMHGRCFRPVPAPVAGLCLLVLSLVPALPRLSRPFLMSVSMLGVALLYGGLCILAALPPAGYLAPVVGPVLGLAFSTLAVQALYWTAEERQRRDLQRLEAAKQEFTDMLVHDMKGRTASITMSVDLLAKGMDAQDARSRKLLSALRTSSDHLLNQMSALLDIRRMQEGALQLNLQSTDLCALLRGLEQEYGPGAALSDHTLLLAPLPDPPARAEVDPSLFSRIIENLIWNALHYARKGSTIELGITPGEEEAWCLYVTNRGEAIPVEAQKTMFDPFVTGGRDWPHARASSIGLGLAFCKRAAEAHGASLRVRSPCFPEGGGVRVEVLLPPTLRG